MLSKEKIINKVKVPPTTKRVERHTSDKVNEKIYQETIDNISKYEDANFDTLSDRISQLDKEWDTERILETNASSIILSSAILGFVKNPRWFILSGVTSLFLLQHAVQGWCPPVSIIRRLGIRTPEEILNERTLIKYLRGDFWDVDKKTPVDTAKILKKLSTV